MSLSQLAILGRISNLFRALRQKWIIWRVDSYGLKWPMTEVRRAVSHVELNKPTFELSEPLRRRRRTLLGISLVSLLLVIWGIRPKKLPALGIEDVDTHLPFELLIFICLLYFLIYFASQAYRAYRVYVREYFGLSLTSGSEGVNFPLDVITDTGNFRLSLGIVLERLIPIGLDLVFPLLVGYLSLGALVWSMVPWVKWGVWLFYVLT